MLHQNYITYLPFFGPTFGTYDELALIASSKISPDSIPSGLSQESVNKLNYRLDKCFINCLC